MQEGNPLWAEPVGPAADVQRANLVGEDLLVGVLVSWRSLTGRGSRKDGFRGR